MWNRALRLARTVLLIAVAALSSPSPAKDQRLIVEGQVNGLPAKFALDTGTSFALAIPRRALDKFNLTIEQKSLPGTAILQGFSNPFTLKLPPDYTANDVRFAVIEDAPAGLVNWEFDALLGWPAMRLKQFKFRMLEAHDKPLSPALSPSAGAAAFPMLPEDTLMFDADPGTKSVPVLIDTGWSGGVQLSSDLWKLWRAKNMRPSTLHASFSPQTELAVTEQVFAPELKIGGLKLRNVVVSERPVWLPTSPMEPKVVLGLEAFTHHELLIDAPGNRVFIGKPERTLRRPAYNRLGALFLPDAFAARVVPRSPAALADIRDGDILQLTDGMPPGQYEAQRPERSIWEQPAGTRVQLTLLRAGQRIEREVTLRDFIEP